jgi:prepilin-type N-terminal cleavage/methylation domain-containing protein
MKRIHRIRSDDEGFTLIELLMVIIILAILATVVVFSVTGITNNGEVAACQTQLRTNTAAESYYAQQSQPAANLGALVTAGFLHADNNFKTSSGLSVTVGTGSNVYTVNFAPGSAGPPATAGDATSTTCS